MQQILEEQIRHDRVLVTGATGFTGGHLARRLRQLGASVRILIRPDSSNRERIRNSGFEIADGDLANAADVRRAATGIDRIFHIAAVYRSARHPDSYYHDINVGGTENIIAAARKHDVQRTVHCSTAGVHGEVQDAPADESSPLNPGDIYQATKLEGEHRFKQAMDDGLPGVIFRPVGIYGPGDLRFLKLFKTIARRRFRMFGSGEVLYHLTYIDDLIDGILLCGYHPAAEGETYLLAGPRYTSLRELVTLIADSVGVGSPRGRLPIWPLVASAACCETACRALRIEPPLHRRRIDFFRKDRAFNCDKARVELGYDPRVDLEEGLARTVEWYIQHGLLTRERHVAAIRSRLRA